MKILRTTGLSERRIRVTLSDLLSKEKVNLYVHKMGIDILIKARAEDGPDIEKEIRSRLGDYIYGENEETLEKVIGYLLPLRKFSLAVAESCTGGLIMDRLTDVPGSSNYFKGGIVAYSNEAKMELLSVPGKVIEGRGAVSQEVAIALAEGTAGIFKTEVGLGVTGIAGPGGASPQHPVGEVFIGLHIKGKNTVSHLYFEGERRTIKILATQAALDILRRALME